ncbi:sax-2, partial [Pristionchus pacificus]
MTHRRERNGRRKSDPGTLSYRPVSEKTVLACELPWGAPKFVPLTPLDYDLPPGIYAAQSVLMDLFAVFDRKLNAVIEEEPEKLINTTLQRGQDSYMDNLINTLDDLSELCLPSVLKAVISWYERKEKEILEKINPANENRFRLQKKLMAANYLACLVFIEVLPQAEFHLTVCQDQINYILNLCFKYVAYKDPVTLGVNHNNSMVLGEINAEVLGVLSLNYFSHIHRAFFAQLNDLKKDMTTTGGVIALVVSMKYQKIKTNQVTDFETGISFLDELATFFLEVKEKDVKHAVAGLMVEILLPVASQIKRETNIPALIAFVSKLYGAVNDMTSKKQHKFAAFPLQTCLLCVSQRSFFLTNWVSFLQSTLANLKNRDTRLSRVALESLYRLVWCYMIRIGGDGNTSTRSRLESICNSIFPKGNRATTPRDAPINIFVKIIHFIAQQKLDFAFREIIFELMGVNRQQRSLYPERMNIGIRALMVIADGLQQKEEPPAMPKTIGPNPASGTIARVKRKVYITKPLTADTARQIGLDQYYGPCRRAFDTILRILDQQVGKSLMLTAVQARGKEPEEMTGGDAKPKLDLLRTCVAAIPRLLPDPMTPIELVDMLTRISIHIDDDLREMSAQTLQNLVAEFPEWREHVVQACLNLLITQLTDNYPVVLDMALRLLIQIVTTWRNRAVIEKKKEDEEANERRKNGGSPPVPPLYVVNYPSVLHAIEGFALVMLCQTRPGPRRVAVQIMKECKTILETLSDKIKDLDEPVITVLDDATPYVVRKYIEHVPMHERECWTMDFATVCEKMGNLETEPHILNCFVNVDRGNEYLQWDPWACALSGYSEHRFLIARCPSAVAAAWPTLFTRFNAVCGYVDPNNPQNESRASLLRSSKSKASPICGEALNHESCLQLWQKYVLLCCAFVPPVGGYSNSTVPSRSFSPTSAMESDVFRSVSSSFRISSIRTVPSSSSSLLFTKSITMLRWENMTDMRDSVVLGVGSMNAHAMETFIEELATRGVLREASEKKIETNVRRRKRKDLLRIQIIRLIEVAVFRGALDVSFIDANGHLNGHIADFIDAMRTSLENDTDRDLQLVTSLRLHLAKLVALIIDSVPLDSRAHLFPEDRKQNLFYLFISWCSRSIAATDKQKSVSGHRESEVGSFVEQKAVVAMSRLLCCGPIFEAPKAIGEDGYLYGWLEKVVSSHNHIMEAEAEETLGCMLELNESCSNLREWLEAQCYKQSARVGARCFRALLRVFSSSHDFSCEFVPLFVLCQTMVADASVADGAVQMIELLRKRFLEGAVTSPLASQSTSSNLATINNVPMRSRPAPAHQSILAEEDHCLPTEQHALCSRLAKAHPQLTITVFSEVCSKLDSAQPHCRASFLTLLLPWVENLELVDPMAGDEDACEGPRGWGSEEATQLLLNDLMYLSITQSEQHSRELGDLWRALAIAFPANLPVILAFLYATVVLGAETILPHAKRVCVWIASSGGGGARLAALLIDQLSGATDGLQRGAKLERSEHAPFYKWNRELERDTLRQKDSLMTSSCLASPTTGEGGGGGEGDGAEKNHLTPNSYVDRVSE